MLLAKTELNTIDVLILKILSDSYINHDEIVSVNNTLRKYNKMNEEVKSLWNILHKKDRNVLFQL